jgi:hypothetical protein
MLSLFYKRGYFNQSDFFSLFLLLFLPLSQIARGEIKSVNNFPEQRNCSVSLYEVFPRVYFVNQLL